MVDSSFERFVGDIGNPRTWPFAVQYHIVKGAKPREMVSLTVNSVYQRFQDAADQLIDDGVAGITTTCGFLGLYQPALAEHCTVPVATSALLQVPMVEQLLPAAKRVGILTYDAQALGNPHLDALGVARDTPIVGIDKNSLFYRWIMQGLADVTLADLLPDVLASANQLRQAHPEVGAIVCECTNLTPFTADIRHATGLPIYDMLTLMHWFRAGLMGPMQH